MPDFDIGVAVFAVALFVLWPLSVWWFVRLERGRPPKTPSGDGGFITECVDCEGLGAIPTPGGPTVCPACGGTGINR